MSHPGRIIVDHTHCGRHVTGLERITLDLFSPEVLAPLDIEIVRSNGVRDMVMRQTIAMPLELWRDSRAILVCPGFPPAPTATHFGARVLPYIHDVFLVTRPDDLNIRAKLYMAPSFRRAIARLPHFLVNSQTTAAELRQFCRADAEITLYRPAVRNVFGLTADGRSQRGDKPHDLRLLVLGTVEPRKNLLAAGAILTALREHGFPRATLDIVGRRGWGDDADRLSAIPGVTLHGYQPEDRIRELVSMADIAISTSHDEGLGLPLLELQYAGLPVVAPDKAVFREVLGELGLAIDTSDAEAAAGKIADLVAQPSWRARHAAAAAANLARWMDLARGDRARVLALLARLAGIQAAAC